MSIRVVDPLEVVDIHQADRKRQVIALRFRQACGHLFIKATTVIHAGEFVDYRLRAQLVVSLLGSQRYSDLCPRRASASIGVVT